MLAGMLFLDGQAWCSCCAVLPIHRQKNVLYSLWIISAAGIKFIDKYMCKSHGSGHGFWPPEIEARAMSHHKPDWWLGFGLACGAWFGLAHGFRAKPAHH